MFKEVASLVFDLAVFMHAVSEEGRSKIIALYTAFLEAEKDKARVCRLQLNQAKVKQMFGVMTPLADLQQMYHQACELDSKPEKGERKIADDFVVLINEQAERKTT